MADRVECRNCIADIFYDMACLKWWVGRRYYVYVSYGDDWDRKDIIETGLDWWQATNLKSELQKAYRQEHPDTSSWASDTYGRQLESEPWQPIYDSRPIVPFLIRAKSEPGDDAKWWSDWIEAVAKEIAKGDACEFF